MIALATQAVMALHVGVLGATGGLGREVCYQALARGWHVTAWTHVQEEVREPFRGSGLRDKEPTLFPVLRDPKLRVVPCGTPPDPSCDALVLAAGASAFERDDSDAAVATLLAQTDGQAPYVVLVSAFGTQPTWGENVGITAMREWYLKDVYRAKREQERLVADSGLPYRLLRTGALSYGGAVGTSRQSLAADILDDVECSSRPSRRPWRWPPWRAWRRWTTRSPTA